MSKETVDPVEEEFTPEAEEELSNGREEDEDDE